MPGPRAGSPEPPAPIHWRESALRSRRNEEKKGDILVVRRFVTLILSFCLVLGVGIMQVKSSFAQGDPKKETQPPKSEPAQKEAAKADAAKTDSAKTKE